MQSKALTQARLLEQRQTNSKDFRKLCQAIIDGNDDLFEKFLKRVVKANEINSVTNLSTLYNDKPFSAVSLMFLAAAYGRQQFLKILLQNGGDGSYAYAANSCSILHLAALNGWNEIIELFLKQYVPLNLFDFQGRTPLHNAAMKNHPDTINLLCTHGADLAAHLARRPVFHTINWRGYCR